MIIKLQNKENKITLLELLKDNYFSKDLIKKLKHNYNVYDLIDPYKEVYIILPDEETTVKSNEGKIDIIYEDEYLLIVNKEKGLSIDFLLGFKDGSWKLWIGKIGSCSYDDDPYCFTETE